jgi:hypothetical protein
LPEAFAVQFIKRLRDQDPDVPALMWLGECLTAQGIERLEVHTLASAEGELY